MLENLSINHVNWRIKLPTFWRAIWQSQTKSGFWRLANEKDDETLS